MTMTVGLFVFGIESTTASSKTFSVHLQEFDVPELHLILVFKLPGACSRTSVNSLE